MILLLSLLLCLPVLADHAYLPPSTALNETQALDLALAQVCDAYQMSEEEIRGRWHYITGYQEPRRFASWIRYTGAAWHVCFYDLTLEAAQQWLRAAPYYSAAVWKLKGSAFWVTPYDDLELCRRENEALEEHRWELAFVSDDPLAEEITLSLDPMTLEVTERGPGW